VEIAAQIGPAAADAIIAHAAAYGQNTLPPALAARPPRVVLRRVAASRRDSPRHIAFHRDHALVSVPPRRAGSETLFRICQKSTHYRNLGSLHEA
jgi:hypothetical protein